MRTKMKLKGKRRWPSPFDELLLLLLLFSYTFTGAAQSPGTFTATGNMVTTQYGHRATLLNSGKVLITGGGRECPSGNDGCAIVDNPQLYDPVTGTFTVTGDYADKNGDPYFETAGLVGAPATL